LGRRNQINLVLAMQGAQPKNLDVGVVHR
jgi:hypothetical protein